MTPAVPETTQITIEAGESLGAQVRAAILWRSGSHVVAQLVQWSATFLVIRILSPADYGLFAMTQVVIVLLCMLDGEGLASALIREPQVGPRQIRQMFGLLLLLNGTLAIAQFALAPFAARYYGNPLVADVLRVQVLLYLATPFVALPTALLQRKMDFRHQATTNIIASIASATAALAGALAGLGVWTLVIAPLVMFAVRAVLMTRAAKSLVWPSFDFRGMGTLARYGGVMAGAQFVWFLQSQADVFIAGASFGAYQLGLYTTALFLTQIFVSKLVPPLNEVAFSAYARLQHDRDALAAAFLKGMRIVMTAAIPFSVGLAVTAEPLVLTILGPKWAGVAPIVQLLALAMPFMTLQVLLSPACDASGRPGIGVANGVIGAVILAVAFLIGVRWGPMGLASAWVAAYPLYLGVSLWRSLPVIGASFASVGRGVVQPVLGSIAMALIVVGVDLHIAWPTMFVRLAALGSVGVAAYAAWLAASRARSSANS
ncbi:lipopolysaccharide biosynthesis protein, partial [Nostoc sp. HG1]|nr:lipopolysaccharide biosynthesis protein [Nostoc sp. HG1]